MTCAVLSEETTRAEGLAAEQAATREIGGIEERRDIGELAAAAAGVSGGRVLSMLACARSYRQATLTRECDTSD